MSKPTFHLQPPTDSRQVDVGTVKNISAEAIRVVLWILGFMSFGYGTREFEVTTARLGCYRPEEHIDNPKDYADNEDARQYDRRLRGPIDEERELAIDPQLGLKAYIASENLGIATSAGLVRKLFGQSIELGRRYARNGNKDDLYEALRLLGTGCHCLEDFSAHSNYTELALIELGERNVFPHVGRNCQVRLRGARSSVYPIVTGTFGGVDFLHSVTGEFDDKTTQSEIQELEGTLQQAQQQQGNTSMIQELLSKLPEGIFGNKDQAGKADELQANAAQHAMANSRISPRQPEEWLAYITDTQKQIYPILEWHDEIMQSITETIEKIPILPDIIENVQEQVNIFVFSLLAPFVLPIISQIKTELNSGSSAIIQSSVDKQHIVFNDDNCSDPTHSMLSKDHFSNILNEPAGKVAGQVLRWVVPQLISAWDDERIDVQRTLNRIIRGVFHHPALRQVGEDGSADGRGIMFSVVEQWWGSKSEDERDSLRDQLSRDGVEDGRNHKPGVHDHGHGSAKKLGMPNVYTANHQGAPGGFGGPSAGSAHSQMVDQIGQTAGEAVGGGILGSLVGGLTSAVGRGVVAGAMGGQSDETQDYNTTSSYSQSQYSRTDNRTSGYTSHEQSNTYGGNTSSTDHFQSSSSNTYGRHEESSYSSSGFASGRNTYNQQGLNDRYGQQTQVSQYRHNDDDEQLSYGRQHDDNEQRTSYGRRQQDNDERPNYGRHGNDDNETQSYRRRNEENNERASYGRHNDDEDRSDRQSYGRRNDDEDRNQRNTYGRRNDDEVRSERHNYGRRNDDDDDNERSSYGHRQEQTQYSTGGYGHQSNYGRNERSDEYNSGGDYGRQTTSYGRSDDNEYGGRQEQSYESGGFGRNNREDDYSSGGGYGSSRRRNDNDESETMPGGFGGGDEEYGQRQGGYGGRRRNDEDENEGRYGRSQYGY